MKQLLAVLLLAFTVGIMPACSQSKQNSQGTAPNFTLKTADGKTFDLAKQKGKVVVVNFWATWCPPCRQEIPGFVQFYDKYRNKGVEIVGVSLDEQGWDVVKPYVTSAKINYPVVVGDQNLTEEYGGIDGIPTTFIVDKSGKIREKHVGYMTEDALEKTVKALL